MLLNVVATIREFLLAEGPSCIRNPEIEYIHMWSVPTFYGVKTSWSDSLASANCGFLVAPTDETYSTVLYPMILQGTRNTPTLQLFCLSMPKSSRMTRDKFAHLSHAAPATPQKSPSTGISECAAVYALECDHSYSHVYVTNRELETSSNIDRRLQNSYAL